MTLDYAECMLWAAFPHADECIAQHMDAGTKIGLGVRYGHHRRAIRFNPKKDQILDVIDQLSRQMPAAGA